MMFALPTRLKTGDVIKVYATASEDKQRIIASLLTGDYSADFENIACKFDADFSEDKVTVKIINNGYENVISGNHDDLPASAIFPESKFEMKFTLPSIPENSLAIDVDINFITEVSLQHDIGDIKFLYMEGDIEKVDRLEFEFGVA